MLRKKDLQRLLSITIFAILSPVSFAQNYGVIFQLRQGVELSDVLPREKKLDATPRLLSAPLNAYLLPAASAAEAQQWYRWLKQFPSVWNASYDQEVQFRRDPNDQHYERQWSLPRIQATAVWDITTGGRTARGDEIVVAVIDSGFDPAHPDLAANIWQNEADLPGDGQDNDQNGYVDDSNGWNFVEDRPEQEIDWHGQSVAGIIGARGNNNLGVSGINWEAKLMLFSVRRVSHIIAAFDYLLSQRQKYNESRGREGAFVVAVNTSLGLDHAFCDNQPVWRNMYEQLGAGGILSVASPPNSNIDVDVEGDVPTTCPSDFLLTVLRTDQLDNKHVNSGYGTTSIDLGAPGQNIYTTQLNNGYGDFTGTSASAPHLTGAIALLYSLPCQNLSQQALDDPASAALRIKSALLNGADPINGLKAYTVTGGRLNIENSADILLEGCESAEGVVNILKMSPNPVRDELHITYQLESSRSGKLILYNALGQEILRSIAPPTGALTRQKQLTLPALPHGVYYLLLQVGQHTSIRELVVY